MVAGNRPKIFIDKSDNIFLIYGKPQASSKMAYCIYFKTGDLVIAAATAKSSWSDWQIIHTEIGPFGNEMLGDFYRWKSSSILSVMVQNAPEETSTPTPLRILDFRFSQQSSN